MRVLFLVCLCAAAALAQVQQGRVATDYHGTIALFESAAALIGETAAPVERIFETGPGPGVSITAASSVPAGWSGVAWPRTNDDGNLRAFSFHAPGVYRGLATPPLTQFTGVVRSLTDGWELRRPGCVNLSRDGRWAVFSDRIWLGWTVYQTRWVDLWTGDETTLPDVVITANSVADDGSLVAVGDRVLIVMPPRAQFRNYPLPFYPRSAPLDRHAAAAAVLASEGLWRVDLATGAAEPWVQPCYPCEILDVAPGGAAVLYLQQSALYWAGVPGQPPRRLTREGQTATSATWNGAGTKIVASTNDGIVTFDMTQPDQTVWVPGPVTLMPYRPFVLAPGHWVRQEGRGLAGAVIHLNLNPAVATVRIRHLRVAATGCSKNGCHPEDDLRSSWNLVAANAELGAAGAELPFLG